MERKTRTKMVEVSEEYYVADDGTEFETEEKCRYYEQNIYRPSYETRSKRVNLVIKPTLNSALDKMVEEGKIKSKNDLINFLLENYIAQLEG